SPAARRRTARPVARQPRSPRVDKPTAVPRRSAPASSLSRGRAGTRRWLAECSPSLPLPVDLTHDRRQVARQPDREPSAGIVIQGDRRLADFGRLDAGPGGPLPDAGVVLTTTDHVKIESRIGRLQLPDTLLAGWAVVLDEDRQPSGASNRVHSRVAAGEGGQRLQGWIESLPRGVVGPLIRQ